MLTGLIPLHFDDPLPFSMFTIADINKINSERIRRRPIKFDRFAAQVSIPSQDAGVSIVQAVAGGFEKKACIRVIKYRDNYRKMRRIYWACRRCFYLDLSKSPRYRDMQEKKQIIAIWRMDVYNLVISWRGAGSSLPAY
jgi:hypothetical protein